VTGSSTELIELGEATLARLAQEASADLSLLRCQLVASPFFDALMRDLDGRRQAAVPRLRRAADRNASLLVAELRSVLAMLRASVNPAGPSPERPVLRVIAGGRA